LNLHTKKAGHDGLPLSLDIALGLEFNPGAKADRLIFNMKGVV
jgi:hypothetical protein